MAYENNFTIGKYFEKNYGLGNKPGKFVFGKKSFLVLLLLFWFWIPYAIIGTILANKKVKEWEEAYEYRRNNWYKEYEKFLAKTVKEYDVRGRALKKLGVLEDDPDLETVKPILIHGKKFDGYWRQATNGEYRTSRHEYTYIVFKQEQILLYTGIIDLLETDKKKESTLEFFYSDITSVNVSSVSITPKTAAIDGQKVEELEQEQFVLVVPGDKINFAFTADEETEKSINAMKALIRERKRA